MDKLAFYKQKMNQIGQEASNFRQKTLSYLVDSPNVQQGFQDDMAELLRIDASFIAAFISQQIDHLVMGRDMSTEQATKEMFNLLSQLVIEIKVGEMFEEEIKG